MSKKLLHRQDRAHRRLNPRGTLQEHDNGKNHEAGGWHVPLHVAMPHGHNEVMLSIERVQRATRWTSKD